MDKGEEETAFQFDLKNRYDNQRIGRYQDEEEINRRNESRQVDYNSEQLNDYYHDEEEEKIESIEENESKVDSEHSDEEEEEESESEVDSDHSEEGQIDEVVSDTEAWEDHQEYHDSISWKTRGNITISRDLTQASSYKLEQLSALRKTLQQIDRSWFTPGNRHLASGSVDSTIKIWDIDTGKCVSTLRGHSDSVISIAWSASNCELASSSDDQTIKVWDLNTRQCISTFEGQTAFTSAVAWSADGRLASGSTDNTLKIWDSKSGKCIATLTGHSDVINDIAWSVDGNQLASGSGDHSIKIWDTTCGQCTATIRNQSPINALAWSNSIYQLASGSDAGLIQIWDIKTCQWISTLVGHRDSIQVVAWSPDGNQLATGSHDQTVKIWEAKSGECIQTLRNYRGLYYSNSNLAWSPDGSKLVFASNKQIEILNSATYKSLSQLKGHREPVTTLAWLSGFEYSKPTGHSEVLKGPKRLDPSIDLTAILSLRYTHPVNSTPTYPSWKATHYNESALQPPTLQGSSNPPSLGTKFLHHLPEHSIGVIISEQKMDLVPEPSIPITGAMISGTAGASWKEMAQRIAQLEEENENLKANPQTSTTPTAQIFHVIDGDPTTYLSAPSWGGDDDGNLVLRGHSPIHDPKSYVDRRPNIAFVVHKIYSFGHQTADVRKAQAEATELPNPEIAGETIRLISNDMILAMEEFCRAHPDFGQNFSDWDKERIPSPYLFWYHYRDNSKVDTLPNSSRNHMNLLTEWIESNYRTLYLEVEEQFSKNLVSGLTMPFLVRPGDVVIVKEDSTYEGYIASSWARKMTAYSRSRHAHGVRGTNETVPWAVDVWSYKYDGRFYRLDTHVDIMFKNDSECPYSNISDLDVLPLRFAGDDVKTLLKRRGQSMWKCRNQTLVSYENDREDQLYGNGERFMIDYVTYKQLHPEPQSLRRAFPHLNMQNRKEIDAETMENDEPPMGADGLVFPSTIIGYNLRQKKWLDLKVDRIRDVTWNRDAFEHLVVDNETKILIHALISNTLEADQGTDVIDGKGNGLIILLHGGPGTGKTFTAESVAEIAKKPLYRVTCGDIGTKPQEVEKYLDSVLYLGKIWDCVVLLDEADVFLEQRTLMDLERNALVSVFLRVLEYYEGILILTSNRVGTFDEAFKSRIQLSLHYEALKKPQRRTIWRNFIARLKTLEEDHAIQSSNGTEDAGSSAQPDKDAVTAKRFPGIDYEDIERHIEELAKLEMNGRQIRNIITTARQLAKFEEKKMAYSHLRRVIKVSNKFEDYLKKVQGNTDDEMAREDGRR